ncbi:DndE family protein [Winogradskyella sp. Asnod2-B02-A]|uniref:DndE family protein n=1 Tax=Winogradskyella sp. Asnod2-B02-A TaxID=3160583 RepID=UPI00386A4596
MFTQIRTSTANREVVSQLTRRLNLGKENTIARIAYTYSLSKNRKLDLTTIEDFGGKEYSKSVLFGDNFDIYIGLLCINYGLYKTDKDIPKLIKMHIDNGLELINNEIKDNVSIDGFDFLINKITFGLTLMTTDKK